MIITTGYRPTTKQEARCIVASKALHAPVIHRKKQSIPNLMKQYATDVLVVSDHHFTYYIKDAQQPLFFHPGSTMFRVKRFLKGGYDPFLEATQLQKGMCFLDCTFGMGTDALLGSYVVGAHGQVTGIEKSELLSFIVSDGLQHFIYDLDSQFEQAMRRIKLCTGDHQELLQKIANETYDVVYFDPMFQNPIEASKGIQPLRYISSYDALTEISIQEAIRVAKKRVVLKAHYQSPLFDKFGFQVIKRKTAQFHYGVIEKS